jgi:hypothetical protein
MAMPPHGGKRKLMAPGARFMPETDSASLCHAGEASHVEMIGGHAGFFAQSSVLSAHYLSIDPELTLKT